MKKIFFSLFLFGLLSSGLFAQESSYGKTRELYLSGNLLTFNNFGLQYKSETKKGNYFRVGVTSLASHFLKSNPASPTLYNHTSTNLSGGFDIGLEKRKQVTEKLTAFYGINLAVSADFQRSKYDDPTLPKNLRFTDDFSISPGLGFNSGFILNILNDFSISAEIIPKLNFIYTSNQNIQGTEKVKSTNNGGSLQLDNQSVRISFIYHWTKK